MQPIFGFMLFFAASLIVAIIASKRGRSGFLFFILCAAAGFGLVVLTSGAGGSGLAAGFAAFLAPVAGLVIALSTKNCEQLAVEHGSHGEYKKCPFCAEPVRREAVKCKHCGSSLQDLSVAQAAQPNITASETSDDEAMQRYGIVFHNGQYVFQKYRYDRLSDAINYAKRQG